MYISSASNTWEVGLCFLTGRKKQIKMILPVHKPLPENAMPIPVSFVYIPGIKFAEAKVLGHSLVLPFARNKDMYGFLFLHGWALKYIWVHAPCILVGEGLG